MALSPQWLDELKARITLSSLIQRDVKLTRAGAEWKACCPFHNEKTPSFYVNDAKGFYHCFGCQQHGSAIDWMMEQRGLEFMDAVKELAAEAGMDVPAPDPRMARQAEQRAGLHDVMQAAQDWMVGQLQNGAGDRARQYLKSRGFSGHTIDRFGFGYAPEDRQAMKKALSEFDEKMLVESGMLIDVEGKETYARFRDRLMLPIHDARGRIIAFGGRILESRDGVAKYLNSPDTPLFDKGRTLYNLHRAGPVSRKTGRIVAVEGYMDVIALADAGIEDAVAPMGTALTETQIELLWRLVDKPVLCFDGDAAGRRAAMKAIERALPLLRPGHSLQIVQLPAGLDPDDLIRREGKAAMERLLGEPKSLIDVLWSHERDAQPVNTPEEKAGLRERVLDHAKTIRDREIYFLYRSELLKRYSDFAYPKKTRKFGAGNVVSLSDYVTEKPRLSPKRLRYYPPEKWTKRERHLYSRLGSALTRGFLSFPNEIYDFSDILFAVDRQIVDRRLEEIFFAVDKNPEVDEAQLIEILRNKGYSEPRASDWDNLRFPFTWKSAEPSEAIDSLRRGIRLYCGWPKVLESFEEASIAFNSHMTDEGFADQQRLLKQVMDYDKELAQYMRAA